MIRILDLDAARAGGVLRFRSPSAMEVPAMCRHVFLVAACALVVTPAFALDMPARKPGLWEIKMAFRGPQDSGARR